jgi:ERCC4-type nuclease
MTVWVDKHEKGGMKGKVKAACDDVVMTEDFGADYVVDDYVIERKRWAEVAGRMLETDRDLHYQLEKLVAAAEALESRPVLLLEGEIGSTLTHSNMPPDRIAKHLATVAPMGVSVQPSTGPDCSARIIATLETNAEPDIERARGSAPDGVDEGVYLLGGVPDVGPSTARDLLDAFGTPAAVAVASREDLMDVRGIGPATAEKVRRAFHGDDDD